MFPGGHGDFGADDVTEADTREVGLGLDGVPGNGHCFFPPEAGVRCFPARRTRCSGVSLFAGLSQTVNTRTTLFSLFSHGLPVPPLSLNVFSNFCFNYLISWPYSQWKFTRERVQFAQPTLVWAEFSWVTSHPGKTMDWPACSRAGSARGPGEGHMAQTTVTCLHEHLDFLCLQGCG